MNTISGTSNNYYGYNITNTQKLQSTATSSPTQSNSATENTGSNSFTNVNDYTKYLKENYNYFGNVASVEGIPTSVSVSASFLQKCIDDPEKAEYLESNLNAISDSVSYVKSHSLGTIVEANYSIDSDGNISMATVSTNDPDGKIAKENAERKAEEEKEERENLAEKLQNRKTEKENTESDQSDEINNEASNYTTNTVLINSFNTSNNINSTNTNSNLNYYC